MFNFLIGVFLIVSGFIGVFIEVFNRFRFFQIGIMVSDGCGCGCVWSCHHRARPTTYFGLFLAPFQFYVSMFGWVFAALEVKSAICSTRVVGMIEKVSSCLNMNGGSLQHQCVFW